MARYVGRLGASGDENCGGGEACCEVAGNGVAYAACAAYYYGVDGHLGWFCDGVVGGIKVVSAKGNERSGFKEKRRC